jgi:hypothetical protein
MNLLYLGDALDHWKGSLFEGLQRAELLNEFRIDAMSTDSDMWNAGHYNLYSHLLRIEPTQLIQHTERLENREAYFKEVPRSGDLFLDPDTGVASCEVRKKTQYLFPHEIHDLLSDDDKRVLIVYQHVRAQSVSARVYNVMTALTQTPGSFWSCSYQSATVAMLFLSRNNERIDNICGYYRDMLKEPTNRRLDTFHRISDG